MSVGSGIGTGCITMASALALKTATSQRTLTIVGRIQTKVSGVNQTKGQVSKWGRAFSYVLQRANPRASEDNPYFSTFTELRMSPMTVICLLMYDLGGRIIGSLRASQLKQ